MAFFFFGEFFRPSLFLAVSTLLIAYEGFINGLNQPYESVAADLLSLI